VCIRRPVSQLDTQDVCSSVLGIGGQNFLVAMVTVAKVFCRCHGGLVCGRFGTCHHRYSLSCARSNTRSRLLDLTTWTERPWLPIL